MSYEEIFTKSRQVYEIAKKIFPGGVNSPVRLMRHLPYPFYVKRVEGAFIETIEGVKLIDYCMAFGPLILGHKPKVVEEAVKEFLSNGWMFGIPTEIELELAKTIMRHFPSVEMIRFVNSGTEATMNAIRLARAYTGRKIIVKFDGCYHGAHDYVLVKAGSGIATWGIPTSLGVPEEAAKLTIVLPYNDVEKLEKTFQEQGDKIACVIIEPVVGNFGLILPEKDFLKKLRELCTTYGSILIFDEVITGFRLSLGGAQEYFNVKADLTTLGKIIGGGFPIGAFGGKKEIMEMITPSGQVYNAGTFNAHPISMIAGLVTIRELEKEYPYKIANKASEEIVKAVNEEISKIRINFKTKHIASMFQLYFTDREIKNADDVRMCNVDLYNRLHSECLKNGLYLTPSQYEVNFTSAAHDEEVVSKTIDILVRCLRKLETS